MLKRTSILFLAIFLSIGLLACGGDDDDGLLFFLPPGGEEDVIDNAGTPSESTESTFGNSSVQLPSEEVDETESPDGDFEGVTFEGAEEEVDGFAATVPGEATVDDLWARVIAALNGSDNISTVDIISKQDIDGALPSVVGSLDLTFTASLTNVDANNSLISIIGTSIPDGTVTHKNAPNPSDVSATEFRVSIQVGRTSDGTAMILVTITRKDIADETGDLVSGIVDGTNLGAGNWTTINTSVVFTATGPSKVDILIVIDDSKSMGQEQAAVRTNALAFFDRLESAGLDFMIGTITTSCSNLRPGGFTNDRATFENAVQAGLIGQPGCGSYRHEAGIYYAEQALQDAGSVTTAGYPRNGSALNIVMITDAGENYSDLGDHSEFDPADNLFIDKGYRVYSIIGLDSNGNAGECVGPGGKSENDGPKSLYAELASNTGGFSGSICNSDYGPVLDAIADNSAAKASDYILPETPISNSIAVLVNGTPVDRDDTNGFAFNVASNSIVFYGTAAPAPGASIAIGYKYFDVLSGLAAYMGNNPLQLSLLLMLGLSAIVALVLIRRRQRGIAGR